MKLYPLKFEPALYEKVWGGRQLETRLGKALPPKQPIGESWEIYFKDRIANGDYRGQTLGELIAAHPIEMLDEEKSNGEFPLLIKFIDAQDWLSVQVHPDDALAMELEGQPRGKTECWYIIDAAPGAQLVYGFSEKTDAEDFRRLIESGHGKDVLQYVHVEPGDFIYVPAGTMHAIGPGIILYELQQTSDTTYRVYDWDRMGLDGKPRELHLEKALRCTHFDVKPRAKVDYKSGPFDQYLSVAQLIRAPYFSLERYSFHEATDAHDEVFVNMTVDPDDPEGRAYPHALSVIGGEFTLVSSEDRFEPLKISLGESVFMPSQIGEYRIDAAGGSELLMAYPEYGEVR
ncbi:MAG TPA: type I phosphomannose isomerase catalytic subunit, partial [Aggregatilineales bacterium]|nr:type I phosphomannose isomerase catalytic subunit [Aggregatilineales bacterium]